MTRPDFDAALAAFVALAQEQNDEYHAANFPALKSDLLTAEPGRRYVRVVKTNRNADGSLAQYGRSVFCFVDMTSGDVLEAASWKTPAKHARGNIFAEDKGIGGVSAIGGRYLR
jgi:hypothetical protein